MKRGSSLLFGVLFALGLATADSAGAADQKSPIRFGALTWESGAFTTELLRVIVERGYGYATETLPGSTVSLEVALARNDLQVIAEEWAGRSPAWVKAEQAGQVFALGDTVKHAEEGWWVPAYVIEGDASRNLKPLAPELHSVEDLKRYAPVFRDPESPDKGRFLNSPSGWTSETVNSQKLKAYGLDELYTNLRTGSGAAMDAEIGSAIRRGQPVLFYYWNPTPLMGRYKLVRLQEPAFDAQAWATLTDPANPAPTGSSSLPAKLSVGVSKAFREQYPDLVQVFERVDLPIDPLNQALAQMSEKRTPPRDAALAFMRQHPQVWKAWLPEHVATKVEGGL
ncbi:MULTISPECIES: ABC transporter substrate-binding protein [Pseudomonas]|uniref:ABC transporter substrate-binding protein n=1 Tax=Pseudomonas parafulva TaxID=157782 RepID=A0AAJ0PFC3_9PSED|nr:MULTISPECIES: ABC transporter substrate-binding protein [Pseudomonas]KTT18238.1 ABC transporter substrate-binding protein [Pseudomonas parafulva]MBF8636790.1 ABC transporter substrate-binding protein [Pseudomonas fulva]MBF8688841.1 ABC transporter substrate-binding protein [Pseudomonas fulva]MBF8692830.1 ABC transporter substrate-binding protein [Pseudomonas fulva]MBH3343495.1 ABC transporter substrate-binding protein [Pseudomonas parafulva]